jgi:hypothetical protein
MRRTRSVLLSAAAAAVLVAASFAEVAAASFTSTLKNPVCTHSGSANGLGTQDITGRMS